MPVNNTELRFLEAAIEAAGRSSQFDLGVVRAALKMVDGSIRELGASLQRKGLVIASDSEQWELTAKGRETATNTPKSRVANAAKARALKAAASKARPKKRNV